MHPLRLLAFLFCVGVQAFQCPGVRAQDAPLNAPSPGSRVGTKSFELQYELQVDGRVVASAKSVLVGYDYDRAQSIPIPRGGAGLRNSDVTKSPVPDTPSS